jgi:hypothetical protein
MTCAPILPDTAAAIAFLKLVYPEGPWVLTGIRPDRNPCSLIDVWERCFSGRNIGTVSLA